MPTAETFFIAPVKPKPTTLPTTLITPTKPPPLKLEGLPTTGLISQYGVCGALQEGLLAEYSRGFEQKFADWLACNK